MWRGGTPMGREPMRALDLEAWHRQRGGEVDADAGEVRQYGAPGEELRAIRESAGLFDASSRDRLLVTGADSVTFVQGLATNDVAALGAGGSVEAAFITPKGKLVADARITRLEDALLLDLEGGRGAALAEYLQKYLVTEQVEISDASEDLVQLELWGKKAAEVLGEMELAENVARAVEVGGVAFIAVGTVFGAQTFVPAVAAQEVAEELAGRLEAIGGRPVGREPVEVARIELGLGRFGRDWDESTNPLEAGLDRGISYRKGCYVGQEVVAKATYIGRVNRRLVRLRWEGAPVPAETPLLGGKAPGRVTSCAAVPGTAEVVALGYVRRDSTAEGTRLHVGEGGPEAVVLGYPYGSKEKPV